MTPFRHKLLKLPKNADLFEIHCDNDHTDFLPPLQMNKGEKMTSVFNEVLKMN